MMMKQPDSEGVNKTTTEQLTQQKKNEGELLEAVISYKKEADTTLVSLETTGDMSPVARAKKLAQSGTAVVKMHEALGALKTSQGLRAEITAAAKQKGSSKPVSSKEDSQENTKTKATKKAVPSSKESSSESRQSKIIPISESMSGRLKPKAA